MFNGGHKNLFWEESTEGSFSSMKNPGEWGRKLDSGNLLGWGIFPGECRNEQIFSL